MLPAARAVALFVVLTIPSAAGAAQGAPADEWPELDLQQPRRAFEEGAFADADREPRGLSKTQLARWLGPITGINHQLHEAQRGRGMVAGYDGTAGTVTGILSVSCCAPLLIPTLLSFIGFSGTALVTFNIAVRDYLTPLAVLSIALMVVSILLVARTVTAVCKVPAPVSRV